MHANAQRILKTLARNKGAVSLEDLAKGFKAEAKKKLAEKGGSRSAKAVGAQASSLVRNHLRPLVNGGYVKRSGRGEYVVTAKGRKIAGGKAAPAPKKKAKKTKTRAKKTKTRAKKTRAKKTKTRAKKTRAKKTPSVRAELAAIRKQLKQLSGRLDRISKRVK